LLGTKKLMSYENKATKMALTREAAIKMMEKNNLTLNRKRVTQRGPRRRLAFYHRELPVKKQ
jgi:hypothetical protein